MRRSLVRYDAPVSSVHAPSWADFITVMVEFRVVCAHPRADQVPSENQVPSEKSLMDDPNDSINRENAALDRMTKGICRGC
jgi:hypothetical protein